MRIAESGLEPKGLELRRVMRLTQSMGPGHCVRHFRVTAATSKPNGLLLPGLACPFLPWFLNSSPPLLLASFCFLQQLHSRPTLLVEKNSFETGNIHTPPGLKASCRHLLLCICSCLWSIGYPASSNPGPLLAAPFSCQQISSSSTRCC